MKKKEEKTGTGNNFLEKVTAGEIIFRRDPKGLYRPAVVGV